MTLKVGMIGGAGHLHYVVNGIREVPGARLCAVAAGCPEEDVHAVGERMRADDTVRSYTDYRDMLDREELDIVGVAPFYYLHAEIAAAALSSGVAVFCEKPLALDLEGLDTLRRIWQRSGLPVGIMLDFRYHPAFAKARELVREGAIGTPTVAYAQKSYKRGNRADFYRQRETFGGIVPWVGIHAIDWTRWVSGREYRAVCAHHTKLHRPDYPGMEDAAGAMYILENGATATMSFDFLRPAGAPTHGDDRLRLLGENGALEIRDETLQLIDREGARMIDPGDSGPGCFADFAESVRDPAHVCRISPEDAFRVTEIALKTRQAGDMGEWVDL